MPSTLFSFFPLSHYFTHPSLSLSLSTSSTYERAAIAVQAHTLLLFRLGYYLPFISVNLSRHSGGPFLPPLVYSTIPCYMTSCIPWFCAPAGHFAAAAFAPLLDLRFCHCLAGPRFGNPARFPRCLRFAKPRYAERILRWLQRFTFHLSLSYTLLEVS